MSKVKKADERIRQEKYLAAQKYSDAIREAAMNYDKYSQRISDMQRRAAALREEAQAKINLLNQQPLHPKRRPR